MMSLTLSFLFSILIIICIFVSGLGELAASTPRIPYTFYRYF